MQVHVYHAESGPDRPSVYTGSANGTTRDPVSLNLPVFFRPTKERLPCKHLDRFLLEPAASSQTSILHTLIYYYLTLKPWTRLFIHMG